MYPIKKSFKITFVVIQHTEENINSNVFLKIVFHLDVPNNITGKKYYGCAYGSLG